MKRFLLMLLVLAGLTGCTKKTAIVPVAIAIKNPDTTKHTASDTLSYLALGDSYTAGVDVNQNDTYPYQLDSILNTRSIHILPSIEIAKPGWTTVDLINAVGGSGIGSTKFGLVTLMIGVNDEAQGLSISDYRLKFAQILNTAINLAGGKASHVFVLSIPDWGVTPFAKGQGSTIGPQIDLFNDINKSVTLQAEANYLDVTDISRLAATDTTLLAADELHPSKKMYTLWTNLLAPLVTRKLKN
jgi:lysophospholipase L1-like esterase